MLGESGEMPREDVMSEKTVKEIYGRQEAAESKPAAETVAAETEKKPAQEAASEKPAAGGEAASTEDPIAGLKSALDKERDRASRFEKDWKTSRREAAALSQRVAAHERSMHEMQSRLAQQDPAKVAEQYWNDPTAFTQQQVGSVEQRVAHAMLIDRIESSRELARNMHEDFDEVEAAFHEAAARDPSLVINPVEVRQPALLAYKRGKEILAAQSAGSAGENRIAKLEAEIAALKAGRDGGQTEADGETPAASAKPQVPRSNAGQRSSGVGKTSTWAGPTSVEKIYGRQRRASR